MTGSKTTGISEETDFESNTTLPNKSPIDDPVKAIRQNIRKKRKNCPAVLERSTMK